jgi:thioredoxin 1
MLFIIFNKIKNKGKRMNKIVCLAALSLSLCGEEVALISKEDAKTIFEENFAHAKDTPFGQIASYLKMQQATALSTDEIISIMRNDLVVREEVYLDVIRKNVEPENLENILALLADPNYLAYRQKLFMLSNQLVQLSCEKALEAIEKNKELPSKVENLYPVKELNKDDFQKTILSSKYVVVDVYADWCGPCKMIAPIIQELSNEMGQNYTFIKINCNEENQELTAQLDIKSLPTIIFYKDGKEVLRKFGFMDKALLKTTIESCFSETTN